MKSIIDTNVLINNYDLTKYEKVYIPLTVLEELDKHKTFGKTDELKYKARRANNLILDDKFKFIVDYKIPNHNWLDISVPDNKILLTSKFIQDELCGDAVFLTGDKNMYEKAKALNIKCEILLNNVKDDYDGYKEIIMTDEEMAEFYNNLYNNKYDIYINQYLIIKDINGKIVDKLKWNGEEFIKLKTSNFKSEMFGDVKPYNGDIYQQLAFDSLYSNKLTMIRGKAGTGKSYLSMAYLFHLLSKKKIDKIIVFCNTVATLGSAKLGYYPGTRDEKLLDSQIGNMLSSKLGDKMEVQAMINRGQLALLPMSDIRGYDTTGMRAGIYICEAQNLDINLMQLALQRIGEDSICIIDGDDEAQVDDVAYIGKNNGMKRASLIFRNDIEYGEIKLKNIYRSHIAELAQKMKEE